MRIVFFWYINSDEMSWRCHSIRVTTHDDLKLYAMAFKFIPMFALLAAVSAQFHSGFHSQSPIYHQQPLAKGFVQPAALKTLAQPEYLKTVVAQPTYVKPVVQPTYVKTVAQPAYVKQVEEYAPPHYEFSYSVHDEHTGDIKSQHESRHEDKVQGQYTLLDADGHHRVVDYTADDHNGFNAVVRREPTGVKVAQPVAKVLAQPAYYPSHY
ncbi:cuticle protein 8-like [Armigeres subalbatus]|uniref:cuticle protein 8-like n=1 Tax=Armigeres subalbatus TaxID=124917 RepID=UPI002ED44A68